MSNEGDRCWHCGDFPDEDGYCRVCRPEPEHWPLADQAHPSLWTGADEAEAGLLGEPPVASPADAALPSGSIAGEVGGILAALGDRPAFLTPAEASAELSRLRREVRELRAAGWRTAVEGAGPARTHEWKCKGGRATVTIETGGTFDDPDSFTESEVDRWAIFKAEILCLAGRVQAAEARTAELREAAHAVERLHLTLRRRAEVAEEDRDALQTDHEQGLEINAELTAALAVLLGEPPPASCSLGCRTPHLSSKASAAVNEALGRWAAMEEQLREIQIEHAELLVDLGELKAQEASDGNYVIRQMRELRKALQARGLWRPAGQGGPGGGTAGSAIEAIDRLRALVARMRDVIEGLDFNFHASRQDSRAARAITDVLADPDGTAASDWLDREREKARGEGAAQGCVVAAEFIQAQREQAVEPWKALTAHLADLLDEAGCAITSLRCDYRNEVAPDIIARLQGAIDDRGAEDALAWLSAREARAREEGRREGLPELWRLTQALSDFYLELRGLAISEKNEAADEGDLNHFETADAHLNKAVAFGTAADRLDSLMLALGCHVRTNRRDEK